MNKLKVLIADDHDIVRSGLKLLLTYEYGIEVAGEAKDGEEAISIAKETNPDLILMDINMPRLNGALAAELIKKIAPHSKIAMFTALNDDYWLKKAIEIGADGYLVKDLSEDQILDAIKRILKGERVYSRSIIEISASEEGEVLNPQNHSPISFSPREQEVLRHLARGMNYDEIANVLSISRKTVETHCYNIRKKVGVKNMNGLINIAKAFDEK